jgi:hypothetical protein
VLARARSSNCWIQTIHRTLDDGTKLSAYVRGKDNYWVSITEAGEEEIGGEDEVDITRAYISSTGGLRVYDLASKKLVKTLTGLENFEVDDVSAGGNIVYMSGTLAVRVDLTNDSAFGYSYVIDALDIGPVIVPDQYAHVIGGRLSPDETLFLAAFDESYVPGTGVAIDALGGFVLADATTLAPVRDEFRMSFRPQCAAWSADSQSFFMATSMDTDPGGVPNLDVVDSQYDYISKFDRDGVLLGSRLMVDFGFSPGSGFNRRVKVMCANRDSTRLYAMVHCADALSRIFVLDTTDDTLPIMNSVVVSTVGSGTVRVMNVNAENTRLTVLDNNDLVMEFDIVGDVMTMIHSTPGADYAATTNSGINSFGCQVIRNTPASPNKTQMFYNTVDDTLRAYKSFEQPEVYKFPLVTTGLKNRYALAHIGRRTTPREKKRVSK